MSDEKEDFSGINTFIDAMRNAGTTVLSEPPPDAPTPPPAPDNNPPPPTPEPTATATAAAEPPKPDAAPEDPEDKWPRGAEDWAKFKARRKEKEDKLTSEIKARDERIASYEARIKEIESKPVPSAADLPEVKALQAELDSYRKEAKEYSERLAVAEVTSHPKFQAYFKGKVDEQLEIAKEAVGTEKAEEVTRILALQDSDYRRAKIEELSADLSPFAQTELAMVVTNLRTIEKEKQSEIRRAEENRTKLQEESKTKAERTAAEAKKGFAETLKALQDPKSGIAAYQFRDNDQAWNAAVKERIAAAERLLFGGANTNPAEIFKGALYAAAVPAVLQSYQSDMAAKDAEIAKLQAQVKGLSSAQPSIDGTKTIAETAPIKFPTNTPDGAMAGWLEALRKAG